MDAYLLEIKRVSIINQGLYSDSNRAEELMIIDHHRAQIVLSGLLLMVTFELLLCRIP